MTLNVTVLTHDFVACVTDRRISAWGKVHTERGRKLIQVDTGSFKGLIAYNGVGRSSEGERPNDWVADAQLGSAKTLHQFCDRLKEISEPRLKALAPQFGDNPRHTFVVAGFELGTPVMGLLSNYEGIEGQDEARAADQMTLHLVTPRPETPFGWIITGATNIVKRRSTDALVGALRARADRKAILTKMTKIIRDTSYVDRIRGSVGSSTLSSVYDPIRGFDMSGDAVGGSRVIDMPDALLQGMQFRDIWITGGFDAKSHYDPKAGRVIEHEPPCPVCGTPVPEGRRQCGACDYKILP